MTVRFLCLVIFVCILVGTLERRHTEQELTMYLTGYHEKVATNKCYTSRVLRWDSQTDLRNETKLKIADEFDIAAAKFYKSQWEEYWRDSNYKRIKNLRIRRQLKMLSVLGTAALNTSLYAKLNDHLTAMMNNYSMAKMCPYNNKECNLETEGIILDTDGDLMVPSGDYDELAYLWGAWRNASGVKIKNDFQQYVGYSNLAAVANGFPDTGAMWRSVFEMRDFEAVVDDLWEQVKPLYIRLHSYARKKLMLRYGNRMGDNELIPAHLLGNMWAQTWSNLYHMLELYPNASSYDLTVAMREQNYTIMDMFKTADDFFISLGLDSNSKSFNESLGALIKRPPNKEVVCHPSAWDFCDGKTYRLKMCTEINEAEFSTIHHEMGHIAYSMLFRKQPFVFRVPTNLAVNEAIGDVINLSAFTTTHLKKRGLLRNYTDNYESDINTLMRQALIRVAILPYSLVVDKWRWDVFSGKVKKSEWNSHWWNLREKFQMVKAPIPRSENDFDPGAKFHIAADSQYISYFLSLLMQFQMHRGLCIISGNYDPQNSELKPLHKCDNYNSTNVGDLLRDALSLGASRHWTEVLYIISGERSLNGGALLEYFLPLVRELDKLKRDTAVASSSQ